MSPLASDIPINCITLLFRLHLFGNLTSKSAQSRPMLHAHVTGGLCKCSVFTEYSCEFSFTQLARWARWLRGQEPAKWAAAGRDRKPGVKDILRAEITPRCWEHEQPVRVSFTHQGSCSQCKLLSDQRWQKIKQLRHRHHFFHSP